VRSFEVTPVVLVKLTVASSGNRNIAPVAGSTTSKPTNPPNKRLPKYHPFKPADTVPLVAVYPAIFTSNSYRAAEKYPLDAGSVRVVGVMLRWISRPLLSEITISAPFGLLLNVTGQSDLLTMLAHPAVRITEAAQATAPHFFPLQTGLFLIAFFCF
jgi:hypothetical protein